MVKQITVSVTLNTTPPDNRTDWVQDFTQVLDKLEARSRQLGAMLILWNTLEFRAERMGVDDVILSGGRSTEYYADWEATVQAVIP